MKGSVYVAKERMKWVWLIPMVIMFSTHIILKNMFEKSIDYWGLFLIIGVWNIVITKFFIDKIWRKIKVRFVQAMIKKTLNYHRISIMALIKKDFPTVKVIIDKCLPKYDPLSIMSHFIVGAYVMGTDDTKQLNSLLNEINKTEL